MAHLVAQNVAEPARIAPSVVASAGRAVVPSIAELAWRPTEPADVDGLFESVEIEGDAAASLWKIYDVFTDDGTYSGAALVLGASYPGLETLSGIWTLEGGVLHLGAGQTARVWTAPDHLRLEGDGGIGILRRVAVQ